MVGGAGARCLAHRVGGPCAAAGVHCTTGALGSGATDFQMAVMNPVQTGCRAIVGEMDPDQAPASAEGSRAALLPGVLVKYLEGLLGSRK